MIIIKSLSFDLSIIDKSRYEGEGNTLQHYFYKGNETFAAISKAYIKSLLNTPIDQLSKQQIYDLKGIYNSVLIDLKRSNEVIQDTEEELTAIKEEYNNKKLGKPN